MANYPGAKKGIFSKQYVNFIYIPSALLLVGCAITKVEWLPYAAGLAIALGSWQFYDMQLRPTLKASEFQDFELKEKTVLSSNTAIYRFKLPTAKSVLGLPTGQHVSVAATLPGQPRQTQRSYTPITSDEENHGYFDLMVKSYEQGLLSKHMASLQIGQTLKFQGPKGAMKYSPNMVRRLGMIAGGTGITPMLQIIKAIHRSRPKFGGNDTTQVDLIFANVNKDDILLKEDLDTLAKEDDKINVFYVLNNPPEGWKGGVGFVTPDMIKKHLPTPAKDMKILICGPPPMVNAMKNATEKLGYEKAKSLSKLPDQVFCF